MRTMLGCVLGLLVIATGCDTVQTIELKCKCQDGTMLTLTATGCDRYDEELHLQNHCTDNKGTVVGSPEIVDTEYYWAWESPCPASRQALLPETLTVAAAASTVQRLTVGKASTADVQPVCESSPAIDFTVTATNARQEEVFPCRDVRTVRVGYRKWIAATQAIENVFTDATIPFGSSHTFTVTDAYARDDNGNPDPRGVADHIYIVFEGFSEAADSKCTPIPIDQGGHSRSFNGVVKDGGVVDVTLLMLGEGNNLAYTITNPPASDVQPSAADGEVLTPIPDPRFARGR